MSENSKIQWCHATFNPWRGCAKVHAGCTNCYAEKAMPNVMRKGGPLKWGEPWQGGERVVASEAMWREPLKWASKAAQAGVRHRVFCASLADVLEVPSDPPSSLEDLEPAAARAREARDALHHARDRLWETIRKTTAPGFAEPHLADWTTKPGLDWLLLTKRPENWKLVPEDVRPLVWLGTSVSDQETMNVWGQRLMEARGFRYLFISLEPMLGPVNAEPWLKPIGVVSPDPHGRDQGLDWVIVGGESGSKARPCNVEWVRSIVRQCSEAKAPCFVKQLGAQPMDREETWNDWRSRGASFVSHVDGMGRVILADSKGGDMAEWPADLRVQMFPGQRWEGA